MMQLNTGASVTQISKKVFRTFVGDKLELRYNSTLMKTYTAKSLHVLCEAGVELMYEGQTGMLPISVVNGDWNALFRQNWLR